jgi:hypothetical protein
MNTSFTNIATFGLAKKVIGSKGCQSPGPNSLWQTKGKSLPRPRIQLASKPSEDEHKRDEGFVSWFLVSTPLRPRLHLNLLLLHKCSKSTDFSRSTALPPQLNNVSQEGS